MMKRLALLLWCGVCCGSMLMGSATKKIREDFDFFKPVAEFNQDAVNGDLKGAYDTRTNWNPLNWVGSNYFFPLPVYGALYYKNSRMRASGALFLVTETFLTAYHFKEKNDINVLGVQEFLSNELIDWLFCDPLEVVKKNFIEDKGGMGGEARVNRYLNLVARQLLTTCLKDDPIHFASKQCPLRVGVNKIPVYGFDFASYGYEPLPEPTTEELLALIDRPELLLRADLEELMRDSLFGERGVTIEALCTKFEDSLPAALKKLFIYYMETRLKEVSLRLEKQITTLAQLFKAKGPLGSSLGTDMGQCFLMVKEVLGEKSDGKGLRAFLAHPKKFLEKSKHIPTVIAFNEDPEKAINDQLLVFKGLLSEAKENIAEPFDEVIDDLVYHSEKVVEDYLDDHKAELLGIKEQWLKNENQRKKVEQELKDKALEEQRKKEQENAPLKKLAGALDLLANQGGGWA